MHLYELYVYGISDKEEFRGFIKSNNRLSKFLDVCSKFLKWNFICARNVPLN